ncbi:MULTISPECIES: carbon starvation CstA family protein [Oceanotoga]|jgi:carbon starvation protein CstA|uniref:Carbon starvation protein CstA n=1 Tax=Oceanotoga teriensis TaxID=515440 RepID=A0AA45C6P9_9BACT|nr:MULTISPECIES: carbon starvation protein A [Oceanotoga]MDN5342829.1 hypothetical protein [Oceanotoga sp.]MDO7977796.1 carbon starvation protein A [Oceanotoga teriensis]PWJ93201.1 carbon starvation protein CstA [Oceanotoga teriensis]
MITFLVSIGLLILGYFTYGKVVEKIFGIEENRKTPAIELEDGVDYVPMKGWKIFLIQFLNIAGLGPIFGAIAGALWGPIAYLWIILGSIFAGGVHDFFSGMLSVRHAGASASEIVGTYLGNTIKQIMRVFTVVLLILVGVVFVTGPAGLLNNLTNWSTNMWVIAIILYYLFATVLPVDKIIGKVYPIFGLSLMIMAIGIGFNLIFKGYNMPEMTFSNLHPASTPIFPFLFITIACGAISGFHATQSPMMARCLTNERQGRKIFYGAMIAEGIIAMVWAAAAMSFYNGTNGLSEVLANGGPAVVVNEISNTLMGKIGGILAVLGVIAAPITSGDTAFRSARLTIADSFKLNQRKPLNRYLIAIPLFIVGFALTKINFSIIWRYFSWSNQTLAMIVLWAAAAYLAFNKKNHWITTIPAIFMTAVTVSYILQAPEGFKLNSLFSNIVGIIIAIVFFILFISRIKKTKIEPLTDEI